MTFNVGSIYCDLVKPCTDTSGKLDIPKRLAVGEEIDPESDKLFSEELLKNLTSPVEDGRDEYTLHIL